MESAPSRPLELFYCYADEDTKQQKALDAHLATLKSQNLIQTWCKEAISPGAPWRKEIAAHLNTAHIILLLISADFIASETCYRNEMTCAIERHQKKEARVIPVLLRHVDRENTPFSELQVLPSNGEPIAKWRDRDEAYTNVAEGIRRVVTELLENNHQVPPSVPAHPPISRRQQFPKRSALFVGIIMVVVISVLSVLLPPILHHLSSGVPSPSASSTSRVQTSTPPVAISPTSDTPQALPLNVREAEPYSPYCMDTSGTKWEIVHPEALCSHSTLTMDQTGPTPSEIDLSKVGGFSYRLPQYVRVRVQALFLSDQDGLTYATVVLHTLTGNESYAFAVQSNGAWRLQRTANFQTKLIQSGSISPPDLSLPITIGIVGQNNVFYFSLSQGGNGPIPPNNCVVSYTDPTPMGGVGLMVQHDHANHSSTIQFTNFFLNSSEQSPPSGCGSSALLMMRG